MPIHRNNPQPMKFKILYLKLFIAKNNYLYKHLLDIRENLFD